MDAPKLWHSEIVEHCLLYHNLLGWDGRWFALDNKSDLWYLMPCGVLISRDLNLRIESYQTRFLIVFRGLIHAFNITKFQHSISSFSNFNFLALTHTIHVEGSLSFIHLFHKSIFLQLCFWTIWRKITQSQPKKEQSNLNNGHIMCYNYFLTKICFLLRSKANKKFCNALKISMPTT